MATVHDLAAYLLALHGPMGAMKLQKLVYYSQAWALVWDGRPIFDERIEAWAKGPVVPDLYGKHRGQPYVSSLPDGDAAALGAAERATADAVHAVFGGWGDQRLSRLTHAEPPWREVPRNGEITTSRLLAHYGSYRVAKGEFPPEVLRGLAVLAHLEEDEVDDFLEGDVVNADGLEAWLVAGTGPWNASRD